MKMVGKGELKELKQRYKKGSEIELLDYLEGGNNSSTKLSPGDRGTVQSVDDMGHIHMSWYNNKGSLSLIAGVDKFRIIKRG